MMRRSLLATTCLAGLVAFATGCITLDPAAVEDARAAVEAARTDPNVAPMSIDLEEAERHLAAAEEALGGRYQATVDHEAYMAATHARIAQTEGQARLAQEATSAFLARAVQETAQTRKQVDVAVRRARALDALQTDRGLVLTLGGVLFGFDSDELKPEAQKAVSRVAGFLIALDNREVLVEGYTDDIGEAEYNLGLSKRRADAVRAALVGNQVAPSRILADGYGANFPIADNETDEGRQKNRRVEIIILEPGQSAAQAQRRMAPPVATGPE